MVLFDDYNLFQEENHGSEDWAQFHPIPGNWKTVGLEQFTLCFWVYVSFFNTEYRSLVVLFLSYHKKMSTIYITKKLLKIPFSNIWALSAVRSDTIGMPTIEMFLHNDLSKDNSGRDTFLSWDFPDGKEIQVIRKKR